MTKQSLIVFNLPALFNFLNEIKENFNFDLYNFNKKKDLDLINESSYGNFLIVTNYKNKDNLLICCDSCNNKKENKIYPIETIKFPRNGEVSDGLIKLYNEFKDK